MCVHAHICSLFLPYFFFIVELTGLSYSQVSRTENILLFLTLWRSKIFLDVASLTWVLIAS